MFLPEGTLVRPSDDEMRTASKLCQILFNGIGNMPSPYPEGCLPLASDDYERTLIKINALQQ